MGSYRSTPTQVNGLMCDACLALGLRFTPDNRMAAMSEVAARRAAVKPLLQEMTNGALALVEMSPYANGKWTTSYHAQTGHFISIEHDAEWLFREPAIIAADIVAHAKEARVYQFCNLNPEARTALYETLGGLADDRLAAVLARGNVIATEIRDGDYLIGGHKVDRTDVLDKIVEAVETSQPAYARFFLSVLDEVVNDRDPEVVP